jgi:hypothetical protein
MHRPAFANGYGAAVFLRAKTGGKGIRTPDLLIANETLYQLSYTPLRQRRLSRSKKFSSSIVEIAAANS